MFYAWNYTASFSLHSVFQSRAQCQPRFKWRKNQFHLLMGGAACVYWNRRNVDSHLCRWHYRSSSSGGQFTSLQHAVHTPKMPRNLIQLWPQVQSPLSYDLHVDEAAGLQLFWFGYLLTKKTSYSPRVPIHLIYNFETGTADTAIRE